MTNRNWFEKISLTTLGILVGWCAGEAYIHRSNYIPNTSYVQQGYAIPNKLEIKLQDSDKNGEDETIMKYDGESYLLRLDKYGRPKVQDYKLGPADEIVAVELEGADYYNVPMP